MSGGDQREMSDSDRRARHRLGWSGRLALVAVGFAILAAGELGLRLIGGEGDTSVAASGFAGSPPLFIKEKQADASYRYVVHPARRQSFPAQSFSAARPAGANLIFCLGGSSVYGYPYGAEIAFPRRLEAMLRRRHPGRDIEVVNVGGLSYGSERETLLVAELVRYRPDLLVIYTGHNEFVEEDFQRLAGAPGRLQKLARWLRGMALYRYLARLVPRSMPEAPTGPAASFGVDVERREGRFVSPQEAAASAARFRRNLVTMVETSLAAGVTPVLVTVGVNLGGWRPEAGSLSPQLPAAAVLRFGLEQVEAQASERRGDLAQAAASYERASAIDPGYAELSFRAATVMRRMGLAAEARAHFVRALETDAAPIRSLPQFNRALREIAGDRRVPLLDMEVRFAEHSRDGIPDDDLFFDYCHPNLSGHALIAHHLVEVCEGPLKLEPASAADVGETSQPEPQAETAFGLWWRGNVSLRRGRPREALDHFTRSLALMPGEYRPLAGMALALQAEGRDTEALEYFRQASERAPRSVLARNQWGIALAKLGRTDEALAAFAAAHALAPRARGVLNNIGGVYLARNEQDRALEAFLAERELGAHLPGLNRNLGLLAFARDDIAAAADHFVAELRLDPDNGRGAYYLALAWEKLGRLQEATLAAQLALASEPDRAESRELAARLGLRTQ